MKGLFVGAALLLGAISPAFAGGGFAPGNPWFQQFESTCRVRNVMRPECRGSVLGAYAASQKTVPASVQCDFRQFWRVKDAKYAGKVVGVLPWQDVVEQIVAQRGVCHRVGR